MAFLTPALPFIQAAGTAIAVGSTIAQGRADEQIGKIRAKQERQQGLAAIGQSQIVAAEERRRAAFLSSRVTALAAASGTGLDSPDIQQRLTDIDERGEFNALSALHSGATGARTRRFAADVAEFEGKQARTQSFFRAGGTLLTSGESFARRFG